MKDLVLGELVHTFLLEKVLNREIAAPSILLCFIQKFGHIRALRVVDPSVQDEHYLVCTRVGFASFKVILDEKLALFSLHEAIAVKRKHFLGKLDKTVDLARLRVESEASEVCRHYRAILFN